MHPQYLRHVATALSVAALSLLAACDREAPVGPPAAEAAVEQEADQAVGSEGIPIASTAGSLRLFVGDTATLTASRLRQRTRVIRWYSSNPTVASVSNTGVVRAQTPGVARITASSSMGTERTDVSVNTAPTAPVVAAVSISAPSTSLQVGARMALSAIARDRDGTIISGRDVAWARTSGTAVTIDAAGMVTAVTTGSATVSATIDGISATQTLSVTTPPPDQTPPVMNAIRVTPNPVQMNTGGVQNFSATGIWSNGATSSPTVIWSTTRGSISSSGRYVAPSTAGTYLVIARTSGGTLRDTARVTVTVPTPTVTGFAISPKTGAAIAYGATRQFTSTASWSDGATRSVSVTYAVSGGGTINASGLFTAGQVAGTFLVIANCACGRADTAAVAVAPPAQLASLTISPKTATLAAGATQQFSAAATWSTGATTLPPVTYSATGGTITQTGFYTAPTTAGTYRVIIAHTGGTLRDTSVVTVQAAPATLTAMAISPKTVTLSTGATQQFAVTGTWSNGTTTAPTVTYTATGGTVTAGGLYTAPSTAGTYRVIAAQSGGTLRDTSVVTVQAAAVTLTSLTINPKTVSLSTGATRQYSVSGTWSNGSSSTPSVTYSATGGTVTSGGLYTAPGTAGTYRVIAAHSGGTLRDTSVVTVTSPTLTSLTINPKTVNMTTGGTQQYAVSGTWSNGTSTTPSVTYTATGGTVTSGGLYTAPSTAGTYRVIAAHSGGTLRDTSVVTVQAAPPPPSGTGLVRSDNFSQYTSTQQLRSSFNSCTTAYCDVIASQLASIDENVRYNNGRTLRYDFPSGSDQAPSLTAYLPRNLDNMWFRVRVRWEPGFTTTGTLTNSANAYKFIGWAWPSLDARGTIELSHTNVYLLDIAYKEPNASNPMHANAVILHSVQDEWSDGGWYDYVVNYERTSATTYRARFWMGRTGQQVQLRGTLTGQSPRVEPVQRIHLGLNFNQVRSRAVALWYAGWEVFDGSIVPNPFGVP